MIPEEVLDYAAMLGLGDLDEITLRNGEHVYLIQDMGIAGTPMYLHYVDDTITLSTHEESMALFDEPDYMRGDEDG